MDTQSETEMKLGKQYFWFCSQCSSARRHAGHPAQQKWQSAEAAPSPAHTPHTGRFLSCLMFIPPLEPPYLHFCQSQWWGRQGQHGRVTCPPSTVIPAVPGSCGAGTKMSRWGSFIWKSAAHDYVKLQPCIYLQYQKYNPLPCQSKQYL